MHIPNTTYDYMTTLDLNDSSATLGFNNDYVQNMIYNEVRRNNSFTEFWGHVFGVSGCLISVFGIIGNLMSIIILLKPASSNEKLSKYLNERNYSRSLGSFEHNLASFYAYLTALSFCDLFSCIFSILNMLEYIPPPYMDLNLDKYRIFCLSISVYTHPIATTLQALSVWIICAFSVHRCRSIIRPSNYLTSSLRERDKQNKTAERNYFCRINLKNNCSHQTYELKFYTKAWQYLQHKLCLYCFCTFTPHYQGSSDSEYSKTMYDFMSAENSQDTDRSSHRRPSQIVRTSLRKVNKARWVIFMLYLMALIYLIPQMFEKRLRTMEIENEIYRFIEITQFGRQRWFRQIFHLWFYLIAIYILPFLLILIFNLVLLRTYLLSKKRCQRYKLRADPNKILRDYNSNGACQNLIDDSRPTTTRIQRTSGSFSGFTEASTSISTAASSTSPRQEHPPPVTNLQRFHNFRRRSSARLASIKLDSKGRALTFTLLGVAAIFFVCHFPAVITKVIYALYPRMEFVQKSRFAAICLDLSNFLIMVNSSINFLLYIVFGPGKFRQEFSLLCHRLFGRGLFKSTALSKSTNNTVSDQSTSYRNGPKKCSISISENNFVLNTSRVNNSIEETNERAEADPIEELNV